MKIRVFFAAIFAAASVGPVRADEAQRAMQLADILAWKRIQTPLVSNDGAWFAADIETAAKSKTSHRLSIWQTARGRPMASLELPAEMLSMTFSPDGRLLAGALEDQTARLWDVATMRQVRLMRHEAWVRSVAFDSTGEYLATASDDATARIWEVHSGREVARMKYDEGVGDARFLPDGKHILTTWNINTTLSLWPWRLEDLIAEGCSRVTRNLTPDEGGLYLPGEPYRKSCTSLYTKGSSKSPWEDTVTTGCSSERQTKSLKEIQQTLALIYNEDASARSEELLGPAAKCLPVVRLLLGYPQITRILLFNTWAVRNTY